MKRVAFIILSAIGIAGSIIAMIQFISAIRFLEYGRVLAYLIVAVLLIELSVYAILKLFKKNNVSD